MARPLRLEFPGALYHITSRGDRREDIYESNGDRNLFLAILGDVCERYNWACHAYCLMPNHYHLLLETRDANLSQGMRQLNGVYTQSSNRNHGRVGHVFQGRFKSILVDKDNYFLELARYIVLNPVRAGLVRTANQWQWSSYRATTGQTSGPAWFSSDLLLTTFGTQKTVASKRYKQFVAQGANKTSVWEGLNHQLYLGDESFVKDMQRLNDCDNVSSEIPLQQRRSEPKPLAFYASEAPNRDFAINQAYASGGYSMKIIGDYFGLHYSRISRIIKKAKDKT